MRNFYLQVKIVCTRHVNPKSSGSH